MNICREALNLIVEFEGYHARLPDDRAAPYLDPVAIPTIGYGSIWRRDGTRVAMTDEPITRVEAMARLGDEVSKKCEVAVDRMITVPRLHPFMRGALISWTYNLGSGALNASTLRKVVNAQDWNRVTAEFLKWRMAKGVVLAGLTRRREAEAALFMKGVAIRGQPPSDWVTELTRAM